MCGGGYGNPSFSSARYTIPTPSESQAVYRTGSSFGDSPALHEPQNHYLIPVASSLDTTCRWIQRNRIKTGSVASTAQARMAPY